MKDFTRTLIAVGIGGLIILGILALTGELKEPEEEGIPLPPPGYEYCVDNSGEVLGFCRKGER